MWQGLNSIIWPFSSIVIYHQSWALRNLDHRTQLARQRQGWSFVSYHQALQEGCKSANLKAYAQNDTQLSQNCIILLCLSGLEPFWLLFVTKNLSRFALPSVCVCPYLTPWGSLQDIELIGFSSWFSSLILGQEPYCFQLINQINWQSI